jgi:CheY-like chemotaxis protein
VLINLIGNATKFTDQGAVTIYVRVVNFTSTLGRDEDSCELQLDVHDTGAGMSSAQAAKLFQPFEQGDSSITRRYGGSGLGLVISRRLARLMCGDVRLLSSQPGVGSSFRLSLVIESTAPQDGWIHSLDTASPQALAKPPKLLAKYPQLHGRILLVEDGIDNQRLLRAILGKAGADVSVADNGQLALQAFELAALSDCPFQLILTDLQMPAMDGLTLTRQLREQGVEIPIIALTAHAMAEDRQRCLAAGCDDYATKPIRIPELLATCAHWLGLRGGVSDQAAGNPKSGYNSPKISNNCPLT